MPLHLYGVMAASSPPPPADLVGLDGRPLVCITDDHLRAVTGEVAEDERVRRAHLLAHAHVLEGLAADATVVPARFGVRLPDEATVRHEVLAERRDHLLGLLSAFDGLVQLTVHVTHDEEQALREVLGRDRDLAGLRDALRGTRDPSAQVRLGRAVADGLEALRRADAQVVLDHVGPHARGVAVNETRGAHEVVDAALLVDRRARRQVDEAVTAAREALLGRAMLRYVGPQPPYAFLEHVREGSTVWA